MAGQKELIDNVLLSRKAFRDDLKLLFSLSQDQLKDLVHIGEEPDGFLANKQSLKFAESAALSVEHARSVLLITYYLYERCRELIILPDEARRQLLEVGKNLQIKDLDKKQSVLQEVLVTKKAYESGGRAKVQATEAVSHFLGFNGAWNIRPVFNRETQEILTKLPMLLLNVSWHDTTGTAHDAVFQLDEEDWEEFKVKVKELDTFYQKLRQELEKS